MGRNPLVQRAVLGFLVEVGVATRSMISYRLKLDYRSVGHALRALSRKGWIHSVERPQVLQGCRRPRAWVARYYALTPRAAQVLGLERVVDLDVFKGGVDLVSFHHSEYRVEPGVIIKPSGWDRDLQDLEEQRRRLVDEGREDGEVRLAMAHRTMKAAYARLRSP